MKSIFFEFLLNTIDSIYLFSTTNQKSSLFYITLVSQIIPKKTLRRRCIVPYLHFIRFVHSVCACRGNSYAFWFSTEEKNLNQKALQNQL